MANLAEKTGILQDSQRNHRGQFVGETDEKRPAERRYGFPKYCAIKGIIP